MCAAHAHPGSGSLLLPTDTWLRAYKYMNHPNGETRMALAPDWRTATAAKTAWADPGAARTPARVRRAPEPATYR